MDDLYFNIMFEQIKNNISNLLKYKRYIILFKNINWVKINCIPNYNLYKNCYANK